MNTETIIVETRARVGLIRFNRPQALNALNGTLIRELNQAVDLFEADGDIGCTVITGSDKAFAAGADIKEMADKSFIEAFLGDFAATWDHIGKARKPIVAAVAGFALGGGCELAMLCDLIIAADNAKFGQPEIKLGIIPGIGGTQRFTRAVGKAKAMDMILTGRMMDAAEAERAGLVARIVPAGEPARRSPQGRRNDRVDVAAVGVGREGGGQRRVRDFARGGRAVRAARLSFIVRDRRPEGRHGRVRRQASGEVREQIITLRNADQPCGANRLLDRGMIRGRGGLDAVRRQEFAHAVGRDQCRLPGGRPVAGDRLRLDADHAEETALRVHDGRSRQNRAPAPVRWFGR